MKQIKTESCELEEGDIELLRVALPDNPCRSCADRFTGACCGCPPQREYNNSVQPYVDRGIFEIAVKLKSLKLLKAQVDNLSAEWTRLCLSLPVVIQNKLVN